MASITSMNGAISTGIQTPAASKKKCIICSEPAPLACGNCKVAQYCSSECQSTDWKVHKLLCKSFEEFRVRPGKDYRHAIVFGHKKQKPRFIWVECPKNEQGIEDGGENLDKIVGGKHDAITIDANPVRNRNLSDYIEANIKAEHNYTRDTFRSEHSQKYSNECLYFVVLYSKAWLDEMNAWYGNVVFMVHNGKTGKTYRDMDFQHLRDVVDFSGTWDPCKPVDKSTWAARAHKVKAVRLSCRGLENPKCTAMEFPQDHPYILSILPRLPLKDRGFNPGMDAPASVGLPLGFHEMPVDQALERNPRAKNLSRDNKNIRSCLVNALLVKHMREGPYKQMEFILFREDLMDLLPEHVQALADFSLDKLSQFIDTDKCYTKEDYMKVATKSAFNEYFERAKENYGWADEVISPYEIGGGIGNTNLPKIECKCGKCKQSGIGTFENFLTRVENGVLHLYAPY